MNKNKRRQKAEGRKQQAARAFVFAAFCLLLTAFSSFHPSSLIPYPFFVLDTVSPTFPQRLWKSLWKTPSLTLQVPEFFRLLAFCTRARHN